MRLRRETFRSLSQSYLTLTTPCTRKWKSLSSSSVICTDSLPKLFQRRSMDCELPTSRQSRWRNFWKVPSLRWRIWNTKVTIRTKSRTSAMKVALCSARVKSVVRTACTRNSWCTRLKSGMPTLAANIYPSPTTRKLKWWATSTRVPWLSSKLTKHITSSRTTCSATKGKNCSALSSGRTRLGRFSTCQLKR